MRTVLVLSYVYVLQTAHIWANTGVVEGGVDSTTGDLSVYPLCGIFYFPWHRHQIEGTDGF